jgi:hypothetical protein
MENYGRYQHSLNLHFNRYRKKNCYAWLCAYTHSGVTDSCICVVPTRIYAGSKQTSFRIVTMKMYATLDKVKHNTGHLVLVACMWLSCCYANNRNIWPVSTKIEGNREITIMPPLPNLTKIRPMQAAVIYVDRWTDSHDEDSRLFRCLYKRA